MSDKGHWVGNFMLPIVTKESIMISFTIFQLNFSVPTIGKPVNENITLGLHFYIRCRKGRSKASRPFLAVNLFSSFLYARLYGLG